jgi:hypothetical protein
MPIMRIRAMFSWLIAASLLTASVLMASPLRIDARAGEDRPSARSIEAHLHHAGHDHASAPRGDDTGHEHKDELPAGPCVSICCAAGMACCVALITIPFDARPFYERMRLRAPLGEVRAGIEPPVPLRPPRAAA